MLNKVFLMGRLVADPEAKQTPSGVAVTSFRIAVDRDFRNKQTGEKEADFINVVTWRSTAEFVGRYFTKGRMIVVDGRLQTRNYTDRDGNKRTATEVVADSVYFADSRRDGEGGGSYSGGSYAPRSYSSAPQQAPAYDADVPAESQFTEMDDGSDGDLPF